MNNSISDFERKMANHPLYSHQDDINPPIQCHITCLWTSAHWFITEASKQEDGDWICFGLCHITDTELGYVSLYEILKLNENPKFCVVIDTECQGNVCDARAWLNKMYT